MSSYQNLDIGNTTHINIDGLGGGKTYYYRVRAYDSSGISQNSNIISVSSSIDLPPDPPAGHSVSNITSNSFTIGWSASDRASGYAFDIASDSEFTNFVTGYNNLDVGAFLTAQIGGLQPVTQYYCRVRAYNAYGVSGNSTPFTATTITGCSGPPEPSWSISVGPPYTLGGLRVQWSAAVGAASYYLDLGYTTNFNPGDYVPGYQALNVGNVTYYDIAGLSPGVYFVRVRAGNNCGYSGYGVNPLQFTIEFPAFITLTYPPISLAASESRLFVATREGGLSKISIYDLQGNFINYLSITPTVSGISCNTSGTTLHVITTNSQIITLDVASGSYSVVASGNTLEYIAENTTSYFLTTDSYRYVRRFNIINNTLTESYINTQLFQDYSITANEAKVWVYNKPGRRIKQFNYATSGFQNPQNMAESQWGAGNVYLTSSGTHVFGVDQDNHWIKKFVYVSNEALITKNIDNYTPSAIAFGGNYIFVGFSGTGHYKIMRYSADTLQEI
jgi:hypothetical protein